MKNGHQTETGSIKNEPSAPDVNGDYASSCREVFDWDGLLYRLMGDEELAGEIVGDFLKQIPMNLDALKEALNKQDALLVKREAHIIKGASGNVGAVVLQKIAEKIETSGDSDVLIRAALYVTEFDVQLEVFKNELARLFR
jgi:HPt (histidine-containing phosphotransfer) domain-containing protein